VGGTKSVGKKWRTNVGDTPGALEEKPSIKGGFSQMPKKKFSFKWVSPPPETPWVREYKNIPAF